MPKIIPLLAFLGALAACSGDADPLVTEFEYDRPTEPAPSDVLVVDWSRAASTPLSVGESVTLAFGGPRYGVARIDSSVGPAEITLAIPDKIDPAVWLVSPSRSFVVFTRGESSRSLRFHPK